VKKSTGKNRDCEHSGCWTMRGVKFEHLMIAVMLIFRVSQLVEMQYLERCFKFHQDHLRTEKAFKE